MKWPIVAVVALGFVTRVARADDACPTCLVLEVDAPDGARLIAPDGNELCRGACIVRVPPGRYWFAKGRETVAIRVAGAPDEHVRVRPSFPSKGLVAGGWISVGVGLSTAMSSTLFFLSADLRLNPDHARSDRLEGAGFVVSGALLVALGVGLLSAGYAEPRVDRIALAPGGVAVRW